MASFGKQSRPPITTQGLISLNADLDPNIVYNRNALAASAGIGETIIGRSAIDATRLQIEEGELLFAAADVHLGSKLGSTRRPIVFSSFNGIPVRTDEPQERFEQRYVFIGMAQNATFPEGDPGGMGNGIAVKRAGSGTTLNNGTDSFTPGDLIGFRLPNTNEDKRNREVPSTSSGRVGADRYRPNKHTAILKKVTYEEISTQFDVAVSELLDSIAGKNVVAYDQRLISGQELDYGSSDELAIMIKKAFNWAFLSGIVTAVEQGVVEWEGTFDEGTLQANVEKLAVQLGLVRGAFNSENTEMQRDFFLRALNSSLGNANVATQERSNKLLRRMLSTPPPTTLSFGQSGRRANEVPDQIRHVWGTASNGLVRAYGRCMNAFERSIIGTASCYAAPGSEVDYVLRP